MERKVKQEEGVCVPQRGREWLHRDPTGELGPGTPWHTEHESSPHTSSTTLSAASGTDCREQKDNIIVKEEIL